MSNAFNNASIIVTPNGYKASKIYSLKPTDGSGDLTFTRATTATRINSLGVWESVAINVPRLQYPIGGGCPSLLIEPQKTNIFLNSNAPATQTITVTNATVYTISVRGIGVATLSGAATGVITGTNNEGSSLTVTTSSTSLIVTVSGLSGTVYVQVETGSIATSPIITAGSPVTRNADIAIKTGIGSLIGQSEGTFFLETAMPVNSSYFTLSDGTPSNRIIIYSTGTAMINVLVQKAGVTQAIMTHTFDITTNFKIAVKYSTNNFKMFINGVLRGTDLLGDTFTNELTRVGFDSETTADNVFTSRTKQVLVYKTALSDAECISLTTL
jgi:hypothetical protein